MVRFVVIACLLLASCLALSNPRKCVKKGDLPLNMKFFVSDENGSNKVVCESSPCKVKPKQIIDVFVTFYNGKMVILIFQVIKERVIF